MCIASYSFYFLSSPVFWKVNSLEKIIIDLAFHATACV